MWLLLVWLMIFVLWVVTNRVNESCPGEDSINKAILIKKLSDGTYSVERKGNMTPAQRERVMLFLDRLEGSPKR